MRHVLTGHVTLTSPNVTCLTWSNVVCLTTSWFCGNCGNNCSFGAEKQNRIEQVRKKRETKNASIKSSQRIYAQKRHIHTQINTQQQKLRDKIVSHDQSLSAFGAFLDLDLPSQCRHAYQRLVVRVEIIIRRLEPLTTKQLPPSPPKRETSRQII